MINPDNSLEVRGQSKSNCLTPKRGMIHLKVIPVGGGGDSLYANGWCLTFS